MKRLFTILPILLIILTGCNKEPYAEADITPNPAYVGEDISFTNYSSNTEYSEWEMGDGTTSSAFNVIHYYYDPGLYDVTLKSFGKKGGVNTASFVVDVIGSELKIIVKEYWDEYLLPGASVILYPTLNDWEEETNSVVSAYTNNIGECSFSNLSYQVYYVDVWEQDHDNYTLAADDVEFIKTQQLPGGYDHTFIAYVDYYLPGAKKSVSTTIEKKKLLKEEASGESREMKPNKISKPRKK